MTTLILFALFSILALFLLFRLARGHNVAIAQLEDLSGNTECVDLAAFGNLVDAGENAYLRSALPSPQHRAVQRLRLLAATDYVRRVAGNAAVLLRLGEAARRSDDPEVVRAAQQLTSNAVQVRLLCFFALLKIYFHWIIPAADGVPADVFRQYQHLRDQVSSLTRLQRPRLTSRVDAML